MKKVFTIIVLVLFGILFSSCKKDNPIPPEDQPQISLAIEDTSCTEAWIKLTTTNLNLPTEVTLMQDDSIVQTISLNNADSLLYVDSLLPTKNYQYQASSNPQSGGQDQVSSNLLNVTTMDTISHNFTWQTFTFGGTAGSSTLNDVAIIDENNIWAVGEIYVADTSQNVYTMYNAVHWDRGQWELKRIQTIFRGNLVTVPLTGIFAFSSNDIWMAGSLPIHGDGQNWIMYDVRSTVDPSLSLSKAWGSSTDDMYFVGNAGSIAHYQNGQWGRIESGTDLNINDIYGAFNEKINQYEIIAVASDYPSGIEKTLLLIKENTADQISTVPIMWPLFTTWFIPNRKYYSAGSGIYQKHLIRDSTWGNNVLDITAFTTTSIRGTNINNVVGVGAFGDFVHFNGVSWKSYINQTGLTAGNYYGLDYKKDMIIAVGIDNPQAVVTTGTRN